MASVNLKKEQIRTGRIIGTNHMDRVKENDTRSHSNKNINPELSSGNFHVGCESFKEAMDKAEKRLKEVDKVLPPKRLKKDRIEVLLVNIPCPREITEQGKTKEFFDKVNDCMKEYFGEKNWHGMEIHVDEVHGYYDRNKHEQCMSLEHAHGVATPFVEGKGVNAKGFMTKANLSRATQVIDEMCLKEFGISYRTYADPQHKSIEELKSETNIARNEMQKVIDTQNKVIDQNRDTIVKQTDKMAENQIEISEQDEIIQEMRSENRSLQTENDKLRTENESLRTALDSKTKDFEAVKSNYSKCFNETKKLKGNISKLLESQEIELGNLQNLTKNNTEWQNFISNEQNRIEDARDYLELGNADDFDFER
jgi:regulator of replication initiation timing